MEERNPALHLPQQTTSHQSGSEGSDTANATRPQKQSAAERIKELLVRAIGINRNIRRSEENTNRNDNGEVVETPAPFTISSSTFQQSNAWPASAPTMALQPVFSIPSILPPYRPSPMYPDMHPPSYHYLPSSNTDVDEWSQVDQPSRSMSVISRPQTAVTTAIIIPGVFPSYNLEILHNPQQNSNNISTLPPPSISPSSNDPSQIVSSESTSDILGSESSSESPSSSSLSIHKTESEVSSSSHNYTTSFSSTSVTPAQTVSLSSNDSDSELITESLSTPPSKYRRPASSTTLLISGSSASTTLPGALHTVETNQSCHQIIQVSPPSGGSDEDIPSTINEDMGNFSYGNIRVDNSNTGQMRSNSCSSSGGSPDMLTTPPTPRHVNDISSHERRLSSSSDRLNVPGTSSETSLSSHLES